MPATTISRVLPVLPAIFFAGCVSTTPEARPTLAEGASERESAPSVESAPGKRPVSATADEGFIFPPAPIGIPTRAVPSLVFEPPSFAEPQPLRPEFQGVFAYDVPGPARARPKGRGVPASGALEVGPAGASPTPGPGAVIVGEPPEALAPALSSSFDSLMFDDNGANTGSFFIPPDAHATAGGDHVVSVVNTSLQVHTKAGDPLLDEVPGDPVTGVSLASFFTSLGPLTETFDPKVLYDQFADRWVIVTLEQTDTFFGDADDTSRIMIAVSDTGDPTSSYTMAEIDSKLFFFNSDYDPPPPGGPLGGSIDHWADYPGLAVGEEAVFITANMFGFFTDGAPFGGVRLWILDKGLGTGGFYDGGMASVTVHDPYTAVGSVATTTQPAHVFCKSCPSGQGTFLVSYSGLSNGTAEFLQFVRVDDPVGSPAFTHQFLNIGDIEALAAALPSAPQSGSTFPIATNDRRALDAVWRQGGSLWMTATIDPNAATSAADTGEATAIWWEIDTTGADPTFASLIQQGLISGDGDIAADTHTFFPAIAVNQADDVTIGFSASAASIFPGSYYTTRSAGDALGSTTTPMALRAGLDTYERTFDSTGGCSESDSRWGDYSGAALDPADQCFWVYNQHAIARGTALAGVCGVLAPAGFENGRWGTAFGQLCIDCQASPLVINTATAGVRSERAAEVTVTGAGDVDAGGDLTVYGQEIEFENDFTAEGDLTVFTGFCPN